MCDFFSFLVDERHNFYCFPYSARKLPKIKRSCRRAVENYDSHSYIAEFYKINEDYCNKYEYNPFTDVLILDRQNMEEDREEVLSYVHGIDWKEFCGDIKGFRKFLEDIKNIPFMQNNPNFNLNDCKVFDTKEEAENIGHEIKTKSAIVRDIVREVVKNNARYSSWHYMYNTVYCAAYAAGKGILGNTANVFAGDASLYAVLNYLCDGLSIPQEAIDYINKGFNIWANGYGIYTDINDIFYVYRRMEVVYRV